LIGFAIFILIGLVIGLFEVLSLIKVHEPISLQEDQRKNKPFIKTLTIPFKSKRFRRLLIFIAVFYFGHTLSYPLYNQYLLRDLGRSNTDVTFLLVLSSFIKILIAKKWGRFGDNKGWHKMLLISSTGMSTGVLVWAFITIETYYLVFLAFILFGFFELATNVCIFNLQVITAKKQDRSVCIAMGAGLMGLFLALGGNINALLLELLRPYQFRFSLLFALSFLVMLSASLTFLYFEKKDNCWNKCSE
jgi:predicted MFS family arabinose efflux permease